MRVLLYGDYSNVHWTLAQGLRELGGIDVKVASSGDGWKNYNRDINLSRSNYVKMADWLRKVFFSREFNNLDVVQLINYKILFGVNTPTRLCLSKMALSSLKRNNNKLFMGAFGDDYYWVKSCMDGTLDNSFFYLYRNNNYLNDINAKNVLESETNKYAQKFNTYCVRISDGIIAGVYEYLLAYQKTDFTDKLSFIPFPINTKEIVYQPNTIRNNKIVFLIGIQRRRFAWKGTDILLRNLQWLQEKYPADVELISAENIPYKEYEKLLSKANVVVDQLYSNAGVGMNTLTSLAKGKIVLTATGEAHYHLHNATERPIVNVRPDDAQIRQQLEFIIDKRNYFEEMGAESRKYIENHHDYVDVAKKYVEKWTQ
jgi:hypothetical protein